MIWIARYWKPLAGLAAVLLWSVLMFQWGDKTRAVACEAARLGLENAQLEAQKAETEYWQQKAYESDEKLAKALERKPAAPKIREAVNANPSGCRLPTPVADSLREQIERANKAAAAR